MIPFSSEGNPLTDFKRQTSSNNELRIEKKAIS
jgi:hypothetical protein